MQAKPKGSLLVMLVPLLLALALLRGYAAASANTLVLISLLVLGAWLTHCYLDPLRRVHRHALLNQLVTPDSRWRKRLWESFFSRLRLLFTTLAGALLALLVSVQLRPEEWWVLLISIAVFVLSYPVVRRIVGRHIQPSYVDIMSLRLTGWVTVVATVIALSAVQMLVIEVADTRSLTFTQVVQSAYQFAYARADAPLTGMLLGASAALSDLSWHSMQVATSSLPLAGPWKALAWCMFLILNAIKIGALWLVLLGAVALMQSMQRCGVRGGLKSSLSPLGIIMAVLLVVYASVAQVDFERLFSWRPTGASAPVQLVCDGEAKSRQQTRLSNAATTHLRTEQDALQAEVETQVHTRVGLAFATAEQGVDRFLDWNFSLRGQYTQLFLLGAELTDAGALTRHLEQRLLVLVSEPLQAQLNALDADVSALLQSRLQQFYAEHQLIVSDLIASSDCLRADYDAGAAQRYLAKSWVGMGGAAGVVTAVSLRGGSRVTIQAATRALGRRVATRTAATSTARFGARAAAAGSGGSAGLLCGPAAPFCALGLGAATWVAVDLSINAIDEALNREQMRAQIMARLEEQQARLEQQLNASYQDALTELLGPVYVLHEQGFRVMRDGL
ncbi:hypothetical protein ACR0ST_10875 [Aliidiomarina sp. Khilg15.8]